jgi:Predicted metal-dependent enzyme
LKLLALSDNAFVRVIRWPGLQLQRLTTKEPDDSMVEVAIAAFNAVYEMDADDTIPEQEFEIKNRTPKRSRQLRIFCPSPSSKRRTLIGFLPRF